MPYNRRINSQIATTNARTVSYNGSNGGSSGGGLNERFSKILQPNKLNKAKTVAPSVFSRLQGSKPAGRAATNSLQNRLGKLNRVNTSSGGVIKKHNNNKNNNRPTALTTNQRSNAGRNSNVKQGGQKGRVSNLKKGGNNTKQQKHVTQKKPTQEDLDKALDSYMMKDPKTAQAKLDAELNSYMDEAGDILMDENM